MKRREFLLGGVAAGTVLGSEIASGSEFPEQPWPACPVIDVHCHAGKGMNYGRENADPWTTWNDPQWTLQRMDEARINQSVIFPISNTSYAAANEEIAGFVRRWPDRFFGFAKHDQKSEAGKIARLLAREVNELGLKGLKLHGAPTEEMLDAAEELRIPILCHPARVADLLPAVHVRTRINFILAHLGSFASRNWREHIAAIEATRRYPNLYLETSSVVFFQYLVKAARELPREKLLFGSDGPLLDQRVELHKIRLLKLPREHEEKVLSGNIRRILQL